MSIMITSQTAWDRLTGQATFGAALASVDPSLGQAQVAASDTTKLTYYVRFTITSGSAAAFDGKALYQLGGFSFEDQQTVNIGGASSGAGAGKVAFDPLSLTFTQPSLTAQLMKYLASGTAFKEVDVLGYDSRGYLAQDYSFGLVAASDLTIAANSPTTLQLGYGSQSIQTYTTAADGTTTLAQSAAWNRVANASGFSTGSDSSPPAAASAKLVSSQVAAPDATKLTYYVRFTSYSGTAQPFDGKTLYELSGFSFEDQQALNIGGASGGVGAGKVTFDPLNLNFVQTGLTAQLMKYLASGTAFKEVDVLGYDSMGHLAQNDSFGLVAATDLTISANSPTTLQLEYGSQSIQTYTTAADGTTKLAQSAAWNSLKDVSSFSTAATGSDSSSPAAASTKLDAAQVAASDTTKLTYYVRFTITSGSAAAFDGKALYQLGGFSFEDQQTVNIGGASSGAGAGRVAFDPLSLTFTQPSLTAQLMKYLASGTAFKEVDVLGYDSRGYLAQDYSFGLVAASDLKIAANSPTTLQLGYGSQSIQTYTTAADGTTTLAQSAAWNRVANASGFSTGSDSSPPAAASAKLVSSQVAAPDTTKLTYYVRFTSYSGTAQPFDGKTLYELSGFSFEDQQALNIGGASGGVGAGKVTFDPLNLNFVQTGLTAQLMKYLASGTAFKEVDVLGYDSMGHLAQNDSFGQVAATDLTISANSPTTLQLEYGSQSIQTYTTAADGTTKLAQSAAWNSLKDVSSFSTAATGSDSSSPAAASTKLDAAQVAASDTTKLTYYVRFTITSGTAAAFDGKALYQLGGFSFEDQQTVNIGGASSGAGAGRVAFDPLSLTFTQPSLTAQLMKYLASGTAFKEVDVLGYDSRGYLAQDYSFGLVAASDLKIAANSPTTLQLGYGSQSIQTYTTAADGTTTLAQSAAWNRVANASGFSTGSDSSPPAAASAKLVSSQVAAPDTTKLTYYVRFTSYSGTAQPFDGKTLYELSGFSFEDQQALNIGGASGGVGAGKVTFDPLNINFVQTGLTAQLMKYLASGTAFKEVDVLGYDAKGNLAQNNSFGQVAASDLTEASTDGTSISLEYATQAITTYAEAPACYCAGVLILTERGEVAVENLRAGDRLVTTDGSLKPAVWIGRSTIASRFVNPIRGYPIRIRAGALGANMPSRDLLLSPDHAVLIDGMLIHAGALVNGSSIVRETEVPETFVYYHVELDAHALVLAENVPAETFVDNVDRMSFDNWDEHEALYPMGKPIEEMTWPRAKSRRQVPQSLRAALDARAPHIVSDQIAAVA